jgi:hypothetical protein
MKINLIDISPTIVTLLLVTLRTFFLQTPPIFSVSNAFSVVIFCLLRWSLVERDANVLLFS